MTHIKQTVGAFLVGILVAGSITAVARQGTTPAAPHWKVAYVDNGSIQSKFYHEDIGTSDAKAAEESQKEVDALTEQGYEPFSAAIYNNGIYSNERVWFFRKKE